MAEALKGHPASGDDESAAPLRLDTLAVEAVMIHRIPKVKRADKEANPLVLAETLIPLDPSLKTFFRERITTSLKRPFKAVYRQPDPPAVSEDGQVTSAPATSRIPMLVVDYFRGGQTTLVETSQAMALDLYAKQGGTPSDGLLVVIDARVGSGKNLGAVLCVLKLDDSAALLVQEIRVAGKLTYDASVQPVTLPKEAKTFKAAVFPTASELAKVRADVSDNQLGSDDDREIAQFFLEYLGCALRETADRLTKHILSHVEATVAGIQDEEAKKRALAVMMGELANNTTTIDLEGMAERALPADLRDDFVAPFRAEDGSVPAVPKETMLIGSKLRTLTIEFQQDLKLSGPPEAVDELLVPGEDGTWIINSPMKGNPRAGGR